MSKDTTQSAGGIGPGGAIFIVFLVLKLTHQIAWSWLWVTAPLWIPFGLFGTIALFCVIMAVLTGQALRNRR